MTWIIALLVRKGASQRVAKLVAYIGCALLVIALLGALWLWIDSREAADDTHNQDIGAELERAQATAAALDTIERANDAEENLARDPDARRAGCKLHSRTPENC